MTESRVIAEASTTPSSLAQVKDALGRKRKLSGAFTDPDFARFLADHFGSFDSVDVDPSLVGLPGRPGSAVSNESLMNDLPGTVSHEMCTDQQEATAAPVQYSEPGNPTQHSQATASLGTAPSPKQHSQHRAVITALPFPSGPVAAAAVAAAVGAAVAVEDDTDSAATMPMPNKRRRTDDDEVTSSPNDLVEMPQSTVVTTASGTAQRAAATSDTAAGGHSDQQKQQNSQAAVATNATAADGVVKAILVAKVLTKSDSNSKRVILPRIAVEANLPQLAHAQCFNFSATDPHGQSWPLVIKAWANGQNPKPVYVMEQIGELLKQYKISVGDALALLASEDGKFFLEWNTEAARAAAARPTFASHTFKQQQPATPAGSAAGSAPGTPKAKQPRQAVAANTSQQQEQAVAVKQEPAVTTAVEQQQQQQQVVKQEQVEQQQQPQQQQQSAFQRMQPPRPLMTAVPVNSAPAVSGTFIPTSPCQLLVMGDGGTVSYLKFDDPMIPSLPASMLVLKTRSDAAEKLPEPENLLLPLPELGDNGTLHSGGFLLCPRTPGCTRPAGHQGWCLGHKGYKKRGRA